MMHRSVKAEWQPPVEDSHDVTARHRHRMNNLLRRYEDLLRVPHQIERTILSRFERERDAEVERYHSELVRSS